MPFLSHLTQPVGCWEAEQNINLIQNEEDGRGINSKILNMAIVASGPAMFMVGGGDLSRRSSNPETPKTILKQMSNDSAISFDFKPSDRKSSLILNSVQAPKSNLPNFTINTYFYSFLKHIIFKFILPTNPINIHKQSCK